MKEDQIKLTEEIIETAYKLLRNKLAYGGLTVRNESTLQLELGLILKTLGKLYEFRPQDKYEVELETYIPLKDKSIKSNSNNARVDLLLKHKIDESEIRAAIELKFFLKDNHREPNNRYDVFKDISNLELYKKSDIHLCYFILVTDHEHYCCQESYSKDTAAFDFRNNKKYNSGTKLKYNTSNPYGPALSLEQDYTFLWEQIDKYYFLKIKV